MFTFPVAHFGGGVDFTIDQAIRFNDDDSAYLSRTPGGAGNRRTFTFSCWVKRSNITSANAPIFSAGGDDWLMFLSANTLGFNTDGTGNYRIVTSQVFRDPSAWLHLVLRVDTTNSTAGDRLRLYINGSEVTSFGTDTNPTLNLDTAFNNTGEHNIGKTRRCVAVFRRIPCRYTPCRWQQSRAGHLRADIKQRCVDTQKAERSVIWNDGLSRQRCGQF